MNTVYISFEVPQLEDQLHSLVNNEGVDASTVRVVCQNYSAKVDILVGWAMNHGGQVIVRQLTGGIVAAPADKTDEEIRQVLARFEAETGMTMQAGIGITIADSQKALDYCLQTETKDFKYYDPEMIKELEQRDDPIDWNTIEGTTSPIQDDDKYLMDIPFGSMAKSEDKPNPAELGDNAPQKPGDPKQLGEDQQIDPVEILKDVVGEIQKKASLINHLQKVSPDLYELFVDVLRGIKAAAIALKPPEQQGGGGDGISMGKVKEDKQGSVEMPVGTTHKGRTKIRLPDKSTKWVSAKSGQVAGGISVKAQTDYSGGNKNNQGGAEDLGEGAPQ